MSYSRNCRRCGGLLVEEYCEASTVFEWRCLQCGDRKPPATPIPAPPAPLANPSRSTRKRKSPQALKRVSVPNLSPPPVPRTNEDWEGSYAIQCRTYAGYQHFRGRAAYYRRVLNDCRSKKSKLTANYRARLCENLAATLGKIYARQTRKLLRDKLRKERRAGRDNVEKLDRKVQNLYKLRANFMLQAMSHLPDDPVVRTWHSLKTALGNWDYLRIPDKGFERGVKRPYPSPMKADIDTEISAQQLEGKGPRKIRRSLKNGATRWDAQKITNTNVMIEGKWTIDNIHLTKIQPEPFSPSSIPTYQAIAKRVKILKKTTDN
jgi:hypothetical protein